MPIKRSAGAIIFHRNHAGGIEYLLLKHTERYWNFPKGGIEKGESHEQAAKREVFEETGLSDIRLVPGFKATERYFLRPSKKYPSTDPHSKGTFKIVIFFLAESKTKNVKISHEHIGYEWLSLEDALARFKKHRSYKQSHKMINKANDFLTK